MIDDKLAAPAARAARACLAWLALALLSGCASYAYTNSKLNELARPVGQKASFSIQPRSTKTNDKVLVLLAFSGGGSRAGYLSARTLLALRSVVGPSGNLVDVSREVDLISSVSGGSLAAAYYATSYDDRLDTSDDRRDEIPADRRTFRRWSPHQVDEAFRKNYIARWVANWFWPTNIAKFWFTAYDRTDIMAQTLADNLYDTKPAGVDLSLGQINPGRPNLVMNATVGSGSYDAAKGENAKIFGTVFTFTQEDFRRKLNSSIEDYEVSRAVMASATFPGAFNFMTLRDFSEPPAATATTAATGRYLHLFDGGNSDNLGLLSVSRVLLDNNAAALEKYQRVVVVLVDAYRKSLGVSNTSPNPRGFLSYVVDTNFLDATDSLLEANRERLIKEYFSRRLAQHTKHETCHRDNLPDSACFADNPVRRGQIERLLENKLFFFHVGFDAVSDPTLREALNNIPTSFKLTPDEMTAIAKGVDDIFGGSGNPQVRDCVQLLAGLIEDPRRPPRPGSPNLFCGGGSSLEEQGRTLRR